MLTVVPDQAYCVPPVAVNVTLSPLSTVSSFAAQDASVAVIDAVGIVFTVTVI